MQHTLNKLKKRNEAGVRTDDKRHPHETFYGEQFKACLPQGRLIVVRAGHVIPDIPSTGSQPAERMSPTVDVQLREHETSAGPQHGMDLGEQILKRYSREV